MRKPCTFRLERVACGKESCSTCHGTKPAHGPYWYAYFETGGRETPRMHKRYIGRAASDATEDELRALFDRRQQARDDAKRRRRNSAGASGSGTGTAGAGSGAGAAGGSSANNRDSDFFSSRRAPPIEEDFRTVGAKPGATYEEARKAYHKAAQEHHSDLGGDAEKMKRINVAWERIKRHFETRKRRI